jgi:hypothetical protein
LEFEDKRFTRKRKSGAENGFVVPQTRYYKKLNGKGMPVFPKTSFIFPGEKHPLLNGALIFASFS